MSPVELWRTSRALGASMRRAVGERIFRDRSKYSACKSPRFATGSGSSALARDALQLASARDCDEVAENALPRKLGASARSRDHDLPNRLGTTDDPSDDSRDIRKRIVVLKKSRLDASDEFVPATCLGERDRHELFDTSAARPGSLDLGGVDSADPAARDVLRGAVACRRRGRRGSSPSPLRRNPRRPRSDRARPARGLVPHRARPHTTRPPPSASG